MKKVMFWMFAFVVCAVFPMSVIAEDVVADAEEKIVWKQVSLSGDTQYSHKMAIEGCSIYVHHDGGVTIFVHDFEGRVSQYIVFKNGGKPVCLTEVMAEDALYEGVINNYDIFEEKYIKAARFLPPEIKRVIGEKWSL